MLFNLGDRVEYNQISIKKSASVGMLKKNIYRISQNITPRIGYIAGYRVFPIGSNVLKEKGIAFKRTGGVPCYLIAWDINKKLDEVPVDAVSEYTPTENKSTIISPYEDTLIKVLRTIRYEQYGYIYRVEKIMFSEDDPDETMEMKVCYTLDGQYLGNNKIANWLCRKYGIREFLKTEEVKHPVCVGFNPKEQKWYGWSHRAIYGFGIGSTVKKGDCGYNPVDKDDMLDDLLRWYDIDQERKLQNGKTCINKLISYKHYAKHKEPYINYEVDSSSNSLIESGRSYGEEEIGLSILYKTEFSDNRESLKYEHFHAYPTQWGKGEWVAKTLEDAKQMAIDFAEGVG